MSLKQHFQCTQDEECQKKSVYDLKWHELFGILASIPYDILLSINVQVT